MNAIVRYFGPAEYLAYHGYAPGREVVFHDATIRAPTMLRIQETVSEHFGLPLLEMSSARRCQEIARPRQLAMYLCTQLTKQSLPQIGRKFNRDHTTVIHAVRQIEKLSRQDPELRAHVTALRAELEAA